MKTSPPIPPTLRWRPLPWVVGTGVVAACLAAGAVAVRHWVEPEPRVIPTPAVQRAELDGVDAPYDRRERQAAEEPAVQPSAPLIPWAWLDEPSQLEPVPSKATELPSDESTRRLSERRPDLARNEIQSVAGSDGPDAGASEAPANAGDAALPPQGLPPQGLPPQGLPPQGLPPQDPPQQESEAPQAAAPAAEENPAEPMLPGESCGVVTCLAGYGCCNPSCGVCVAPGDNCDPTPCESRIQYPVSELCGRSTCSVGEVCCNPSCGICVAPGETCTGELCD